MKKLICRQGIETKYMGPTNFRGTRVKATCAAGSLTMGWQPELNSEQNHFRAAWLLVEKLKWNETSKVVGLLMCRLKNGNYVFTLREGK